MQYLSGVPAFPMNMGQKPLIDLSTGQPVQAAWNDYHDFPLPREAAVPQAYTVQEKLSGNQPCCPGCANGTGCGSGLGAFPQGTKPQASADDELPEGTAAVAAIGFLWLAVGLAVPVGLGYFWGRSKTLKELRG